MIYTSKNCISQSETIWIKLKQEDSFMENKGTCYSEEQILRIFKEGESGTSVAQVCRK